MHLAYLASLQALHSDTYKQIIQIQHNRIKNPNWQEATCWLFISVVKHLNSGNREKIQQVAGAGNPGPPDCESDALTSRPRYLLSSMTLTLMKTYGSLLLGISR